MPHDRDFTRRKTEERRSRGRAPHMMLGRPGTPEERFDDKVVEGAGGCWLWIAAQYDQVYGMFAPESGRVVRAHRWSYERHRGVIPDGMTLDHRCSNKLCVNRDHLEVVTPGENIRRYRERRADRVAI